MDRVPVEFVKSTSKLLSIITYSSRDLQPSAQLSFPWGDVLSETALKSMSDITVTIGSYSKRFSGKAAIHSEIRYHRSLIDYTYQPITVSDYEKGVIRYMRFHGRESWWDEYGDNEENSAILSGGLQGRTFAQIVEMSWPHLRQMDFYGFERFAEIDFAKFRLVRPINLTMSLCSAPVETRFLPWLIEIIQNHKIRSLTLTENTFDVEPELAAKLLEILPTAIIENRLFCKLSFIDNTGMPDLDGTLIQRIVEGWKNRCWEKDLEKERHRNFNLGFRGFSNNFEESVLQAQILPTKPGRPKHFLLEEKQNGIKHFIIGNLCGGKALSLNFSVERLSD